MRSASRTGHGIAGEEDLIWEVVELLGVFETMSVETLNRALSSDAFKKLRALSDPALSESEVLEEVLFEAFQILWDNT